MNVREMMLNLLLQQCDLKDHTISELQRQIAEFQKNNVATPPPAAPDPPAGS